MKEQTVGIASLGRVQNIEDRRIQQLVREVELPSLAPKSTSTNAVPRIPMIRLFTSIDFIFTPSVKVDLGDIMALPDRNFTVQRFAPCRPDHSQKGGEKKSGE